MPQQRVVITGLGVLAPNGCGKDAFWTACLNGRSGVRLIDRSGINDLPSRIAGEVSDFSAAEYGLSPTECARLDRGTQLSLAAANLALADARLDSKILQDAQRERIGVYLGTAMASVNIGERIWGQCTDYGAHPHRNPAEKTNHSAFMMSFLPSAVVAARHDFRGPCLTIGTGCSAGADAIGEAFWQIQDGHAERMLAGGGDSALCRLGFTVFSAMHALSTCNDEPERASRPYESRRDGFVLAEGAAVLLLEERQLALARGAHIYAEIVTYVTNTSSSHMVTPPKRGVHLRSLLREALESSQLSPEQLGYINSHGSSTPSNDLAETAAYKDLFGKRAYGIPISSTKSLIGHTQGAASAIEIVATVLALDQQILPPTINLEVPDLGCDLDYIPNTARAVDARHPLRFALSHSSGFGGVNTALVLCSDDAAQEAYDASSRGRNGKQRRCAPKQRRRVVITGIGVMAPNGAGKSAFWKSVSAGRLAIGPQERYRAEDQPAPLVGEIKNFRAADYVERKLALHTDRMTHFAFAACQEALRDAGLVLEKEDPMRLGAVIANTVAGVEYITEQISRLYRLGPRLVSPHAALAWLHVSNVGRMSVQYGLRGYCKVPINGTCGGLDALGHAYRAIARDAADILIAGGTEAPLHPLALHVLGASPLFNGKTDQSYYRPFDLRANGMLVAEGAGICILEEYDHAMRRGASIYGEIVGYAQTSAPAIRSTEPIPDVAAYVRALELALGEADMSPKDVGCVFPDGRAIPAWDATETAALQKVFGTLFDTMPCTVPRTQFGHALSAAGALDAICALLALRGQPLPPTVNCESPSPDHCPPGLVRPGNGSTTCSSAGGLVCARGLGGSHVVLAVRGLTH
jgi:3-oxoacyl-(acyl-carrier-protein) synthase